MKWKRPLQNDFHQNLENRPSGPPTRDISVTYDILLRDISATALYFSFYRYKSLSLHQTCIYGESQAGGEITSVALKRTVGRPRNG